MTEEKNNNRKKPTAISVEGGSSNIIHGNISIGYEEAIRVKDSPGTRVTENINIRFQVPSILQDLSEFVEISKKHLPQLSLHNVAQADAEAQLDTIQTQLSASSPNNAIIGEALKTIKNVLEGAAGSLLASDLASRIPQLLQQLGLS